MAPLISDELDKYLDIVFKCVLLFSISMFGIFANIFNITIYWRHGLRESIIFGFFCLSISDLTLQATHIFTACCYIVKVIGIDSNIDFASLNVVCMYWLKNMCYTFSCCLTALLSLERCVCVISPFKVKSIFTRNRTAFWVAVIFATMLILCAPLTYILRLKWVPHPYNNDTQILAFFIWPPGREFDRVSLIVINFLIPIVCQVIVFVSVTILIKGLQKASLTRKKLTSREVSSLAESTENEGAKRKAGKEYSLTGSTNPRAKDEKSGEFVSQKTQGAELKVALSPKEIRLVKSMIFIAAIMTVSNLILITISAAAETIPGLWLGEEYMNLTNLFSSIISVTHSINAAVNCFVYYRTSSNYRETAKSLLRSLFGCCHKDEE